MCYCSFPTCTSFNRFVCLITRVGVPRYSISSWEMWDLHEGCHFLQPLRDDDAPSSSSQLQRLCWGKTLLFAIYSLISCRAQANYSLGLCVVSFYDLNRLI